MDDDERLTAALHELSRVAAPPGLRASTLARLDESEAPRAGFDGLVRRPVVAAAAVTLLTTGLAIAFAIAIARPGRDPNADLRAEHARLTTDLANLAKDAARARPMLEFRSGAGSPVAVDLEQLGRLEARLREAATPSGATPSAFRY